MFEFYQQLKKTLKIIKDFHFFLPVFNYSSAEFKSIFFIVGMDGSSLLFSTTNINFCCKIIKMKLKAETLHSFIKIA